MTASPAPASDLAVLRIASYRRLLVGTVVSAHGKLLHAVAAAWVMLEMTDSPFMVSLVTASTFLPQFLSGIPAGALADVLDRRAILVAGNAVNTVTALLLAGLQMTGRMTPGLLIALSLTLGLGFAAVLPAYQALVADLLDRSLVASAMALQSGSYNVARAVGPATGGALVAAGHPDVAFALNGLSYLVVAVAAMTLRGRFHADSPEPVRQAMATGLRYLRHTPVFLRIVLLTVLFGFVASPIQPLLPSVARDALGLSALGFGLLFAAYGVGALAGALVHARVRAWLPRRTVIPFATLGLGLAGIAFGLLRAPLLNGIAVALLGMCWTWGLATMNATVQLSSPRWVRGRAMGVYGLVFIGAYTGGALVSGAVAEVIGPAETVTAVYGLALIVALAAHRIAVPDIAELADPVMPEGWPGQEHTCADVAGTPIAVVTRYEIDPAEAPAFVTAMRTLRRERYRTGARNWTLLRSAERPEVMLERFELPDWQEHLRQHTRMDADTVAAIERARAFDRGGGPRTEHYAGVDVANPQTLDARGSPAWRPLPAPDHDLGGVDGG